MITYQELREKLISIEKVSGCVRIERPSLINDGFPGHFNYSFTEYPWLKEYGRYMDFDHDYVFSCSPVCIRYDDIFDEKNKKSKLEGSDSWKYLGVFEMSDLAGIVSYKGSRNIYDLQFKQASNLIKLLSDLGIQKDKIFCGYQPACAVQEVIKDKYRFNTWIDEDQIGKQVFLDLGIPKDNVQPDYSGTSLLSLNLFRRTIGGGQIRVPSPWGYRNEININLGSKNHPRWLDIATLERFAYRPIVEQDEVIGLDPIDDTVSIGAVGLQRLCMIANDLENVHEIDYLRPFYEELTAENKIRVGECIRALHFIYTDIEKYNIDLSYYQRTRDRIRIGLLQPIFKSSLSTNQIAKLLELNANMQPWHPELKTGVKRTIKEIEFFLNKKRSEKH